jgi:hypothetical protein
MKLQVISLSAALASLITPIVMIGSISGLIQIQDSLLILSLIILVSFYTLISLRMISTEYFKTQRFHRPITTALVGLVLWLAPSLITGMLLRVAAQPSEGMRQITTMLQIVLLIVASIGQLIAAVGLIWLSMRLSRELGALAGLRYPLRLTYFLNGVLLCAMSLGVLDFFARIFHHLSVMAFLGFMIVYTINAVLLSVLFVLVSRGYHGLPA